MLLGEYSYQMDEKGRVLVPKKFRAEIGKEVIITQGFEDCLVIYQKEEFEKLSKKLKKLPFEVFENRHILRLISSSAEEVKIDNKGRIRFSQKLREFASLEPGGEVIILAAIDHLELWNPKIWQDFKEKEKIVDIAEKIARLS